MTRSAWSAVTPTVCAVGNPRLCSSRGDDPSVPARRNPSILVVEDDATIAEAVAVRLRAEEFTVEVAADGPTAIERFQARRPDLIVLDLMLPGFDGLEVCRRVQAVYPVPVLMLTARNDESDLLVGLGIGADDYLTKPFSLRELVARIRALLRRVDHDLALARAQAGQAGPRIDLGPLRLDPAAGRCTCRGPRCTSPRPSSIC